MWAGGEKAAATGDGMRDRVLLVGRRREGQ